NGRQPRRDAREPVGAAAQAARDAPQSQRADCGRTLYLEGDRRLALRRYGGAVLPQPAVHQAPLHRPDRPDVLSHRAQPDYARLHRPQPLDQVGHLMIAEMFSTLRDTGMLPWVAALLAVAIAGILMSRSPSARQTAPSKLRDLINLREGNSGRYRAGSM